MKQGLSRSTIFQSIVLESWIHGLIILFFWRSSALLYNQRGH